MSIFKQIIKPSSHSTLVGMSRGLKTLYIYNKFQADNKPIFVVSSSLYEANLLYQYISKLTNRVLLFPMDDFLTSEALAISPELKTTRLETINMLLKDSNQIVITNLMGFLRFLPTKRQYQQHLIKLNVGNEYPMDDFLEKLVINGYQRNTVVEKTGDFAVRGFVIDIFSVDTDTPIRLEFFGDELEFIRNFDLETQRTMNEIKECIIYPNTEFLTSQYVDNYSQKDLIKYEEVVNIQDYIEDSFLILDNYSDLLNSYRLLLEEIMHYNEEQKVDMKTMYMHTIETVMKENTILFEQYNQSLLSSKDTITHISYPIEKFTNVQQFKKFLLDKQKENKTIIICVKNQYNLDKLLRYIEDISMTITNENQIFPNQINLIIKDIGEGFIYENYVFISEREIFHKASAQVHYKSKFRYGKKIRDISKLQIGDYIVHETHGIGKYLGLKVLEKNHIKKDYILLEYKGRDKLYIPVEKIDFISKYSSNDGIIPPVHKLGSPEWSKTKLRLRKKMENIAGELLKLYAARQATPGFAFEKDGPEQLDFEQQFKYRETSDQLKVIEEIKTDMESYLPMDRLLCGDVGFGKTEVAFRAMFKAVMSGRQVAYLCPTTILSSQHYTNSLVRFQNFAVNIVLLNRFVSSKEITKIKEGLQAGTIDIVIGTHRVLSHDIIFKNLGLLVIDEEQRFGVKQKEQIKKYKNNIDVLSLSATPIPRTLQLSMAGIRSLSLIETPPVNRYPVQTYVLSENSAIIKDSIYKELSRDGQVFILYNHVAKMESQAKKIAKIAPDARIVCANGQMPKTELENVMLKFIQKEYDVLLCTTIIETGIDIPNVNTLIIMGADRFGLSQLYQIRGRVGRSDKIAYCYLMYKQDKILSEIAKKRLDAIKEFTELGSGFSLAMRDLSIRGAGDILGSEQAGFIDSVGIELYLKILNEEVEKLQGKQIEEISDRALPLVDVKTSIDDSYVEDTDIKIEIHKKINEIDSYDKLQEVKEELEDRFGKIDENMLVYMYEELFEKYAEHLGIVKIKQTKSKIDIYIPSILISKLDGEKLFLDITQTMNMIRFKSEFKQTILVLNLNKLERHFIYYLIDLMHIIESCIK